MPLPNSDLYDLYFCSLESEVSYRVTLFSLSLRCLMSALFERMIGTNREYADRYYPNNHKAVLVVAPHGTPDPETVVPVSFHLIPIPPADEIPPYDDGPTPGSIRMPSCATAVLGVMFAQFGDPMQAAEIEAALRGHEDFPAYSLSSVEKTLADLVRIGLLRNPASAKPRGYRFVEG